MNWKVPLFDPDLGPEEEQALVDVIRSKWLTMGERTKTFERRFADLTGVPTALACNSATAALHMALAALEIGPGDDVVVPSLTFVATANAVRYCGARPVFADVASLEHWNIDARTIAQALTPATRAIVVVHYAGYPCDMPAILELAASRGLAVVEDVAHAPGVSLDGRMCKGRRRLLQLLLEQEHDHRRGRHGDDAAPRVGRAPGLAALARHDHADARSPQGPCLRL
jgi:dTDP-4-amino-4,6-dideoxygalactose transaminase